MTDFLSQADLRFAPLLTGGWLAAVLLAAVAVLAVSFWRRTPDFAWRGIFLLVLLGLLMNPSLRHDEKQSLPDKVLIVVDDSNSQKIAGRDARAAEALAKIEAQIAAFGKDVEPVIVRVPQYSDNREGERTQMFSALRDSLMTLPLAQVAGTILITDGQVHDAPQSAAELGAVARLAPLHVILTGRHNEFDRKVTVVNSPNYGLIGQNVQVDVRVEESGAASGALVTLSLWQDGVQQSSREVTPGETVRFDLTLAHPGQNAFEFRVPVAEGEMTEANNTAPVIINGVRDRLRVLLVSGVPHMGERAWRNLLKSDPGIDLVHFTILRPLTAVDATPTNELSLIVFPVDELFAGKIDDFDLIIFDKYVQYNLLSPQYFANIRNYVRKGGAFLLAMGSDRPDDSIFSTVLGDILPVKLASTEVLQGAFRPALTPLGTRHPLTADLARRKDWGAWLTQADVETIRGRTLMTGRNDKPLMVIDEVEKGRVAVVASDNLWFWAKGGETAGPYGEMLRNLSHWLMKEPELEDDYIKTDVRGNTISVAQRDTAEGAKTVTMTEPGGASRDVTMTDLRGGWRTADVTVEKNGIYSFTSGKRQAFAVVGTARSEEYADVLTTAARLQTAASATGGGILWMDDAPALTLRRVAAEAKQMHGSGWLGLRRAEAYAVTAVKARELFSNKGFLGIVLLGLLLAWLRESGRRWRR